MEVTLELPDDLATNLKLNPNKLSQILELGWRESIALGQYQSAASVLEFLAELPTPERILALRPSPEFENRITELSEKSRAEGLSELEEALWEQYAYLEHLVRIAKTNALSQLNSK